MTLAVIVPVYNERANLAPFYGRAKAALDSLEGLSRWTIVFVNNGSSDGSLEELLALQRADARIRILTLARNFGYHAAMLAGLAETASELYAIIDVDCEDPPELFKEVYAAIQQGWSVAYGIRSRREEFPLITFGRRLFYRTVRLVADAEFVEWMSEFAMMTRQVRDAILVPKTTYPFLRAEIGYVGFKRIGVPYLRAKRQHGRSHFNFWGMIRFAVGGLLSSSTFPLRLILYMAAAVGVCVPVAVWWLALSEGQVTMLAALVGLYFLIMTVPLLSLYLARTYKNGVARPVYVVDWSQTFLGPLTGQTESAPAINPQQAALDAVARFTGGSGQS